MRLTTAGSARNFTGSIVGRITTKNLLPEDRKDHILLVREQTDARDLSGYRAVITTADIVADVPIVGQLREADHISDQDIVVLEGTSGFVRSLYRPHERHHHILVTERCSSNCLMCSQPPKDRNDVDGLMRRNQELIRLMKPKPQYLTLTGGEPTLLGDYIFTLVRQLKEELPETELHILTNGRTFAFPRYASRLAAVEHPNLCLGVPLYSDCATDHDYVVQAKGAFDQTVSGLHQAERNGIRTEIRVVLHALTIPRLTKLVEYIARNLPFAEHIALMGLEYVGYTPRNVDELWIDPCDYQQELEAAVGFLSRRGFAVSIYNHQLCVLSRRLWPYAHKSISDWKNAYLPQCGSCAAKDQCGGFFQWAVKKHSAHIHPLSPEN